MITSFIIQSAEFCQACRPSLLLLGCAIVSRVKRRELADAILARSEIIGLRETVDASVTRYTTRQVLASERQILRDAGELHRRTSHGMTERVRAAADCGWSRHETLPQLETDRLPALHFHGRPDNSHAVGKVHVSSLLRRSLNKEIPIAFFRSIGVLLNALLVVVR